MFGLVWPSGVQLALHMAQRPWLANERVLEIGCGLALASMVCHRMGMDVTASDCHPLASDFLLENVRLNDLVKDGDISANLPMRPGDVLVVPESYF